MAGLTELVMGLHDEIKFEFNLVVNRYFKSVNFILNKFMRLDLTQEIIENLL